MNYVNISALAAVAFGTFGLLAMTALFPLAAWFAGARRRPSGPASRSRGTGAAPAPIPRRIAVLIPAHDEEAQISRTLASVKEAARAVEGHVEVLIAVGADGCADGTARLAREAGAHVIEFSPQIGKWRGLSKLIAWSAERACDWVALADAGASWPADLLSRALSHTQASHVMAIAPAYEAKGAGLPEAAAWRLERALKSLEMLAGGPVSVHGATVFYRRRELETALTRLSFSTWLNDDVVIPLMLRATFPELEIRYDRKLRVTDDFSRKSAAVARASLPREFRRRRRLVVGNLEWVTTLLPRAGSGPAGILALRRVFRMLWAYWFLALGAGAFTLVASLSQPAAAALAAAGALIALTQRSRLAGLLDSGAASILVPYYVFHRRKLPRMAATAPAVGESKPPLENCVWK